MVSANGRYIISYNGEVYSHEEIRPSLTARDISFRGHSDTEVILKSFAAFADRNDAAAADRNVQQ